MKPYENIRYLRKKVLDLTLEEFSKRINLSRSNLGNIETGKIKLTDRVKNDICREFNVNRDWLCTGKGEPISINQKDIINILKTELNLNDDKCEIIQHFLNLTEVQQTSIINLVRSFLP